MKNSPMPDVEKAVRAEKNPVKPVQRRLLVPLAVVLMLLVGGFGAVLIITQQQNLDQSSRNILESASDELEESLAEQTRMLAALEDVLLHDAGLRDALKAQDRQRLLDDYEALYAKLHEDHGITHFYFHRPDRVNLLRVHNPERYGDLIDRFTALEAERTGKTSAGIELGPLGTFTLRVVRPVFDGDTLIGYMELGKEIEDIIARIGDVHGIELAVAIHKNTLERENWEAGMEMLGREADWDYFADHVLIYSTLPRFPSELERFVDTAGHAHYDVDEARFDGKTWRIMISPLADVSGAEVGDIFVLRDISQAKAAFNRLVAISSGGTLALLSGLFGFLYVVLRQTDRGIRLQRVELAESGLKFRAVLAAVPDLMIVLDAEGRYRDIFTADLGLLLTPADRLLGRTIHEVMPQEDARPIQEVIDRTLLTGELGYHEYSLETDGIEHYFAGRVTKFKLQDSDCVLWSARDITERVRAEEQIKASLREKEVLLKEIHHRVKNNLAIVSSLLQFQAEITPGEQARAAFQESRNRIRAMARIHEHLYRSLDLARIDMAQYVWGVVNYLVQSFGTHAIALQVDVADVTMDVDRATPCGLIVNELVSNALKYAFPPGWQKAGRLYPADRLHPADKLHPAENGPKVRVALRLDDDGQCELTVSDNGAGLPSDLQIESVSRESLGLRLVNLLSRQLEGNLAVDREGGTTFCLTFAIPEERSDNDDE